MYTPTLCAVPLLVRHGQLLCYFDRVDEARASFLQSSKNGNYQASLTYGMIGMGSGDFDRAADAFCVAHTQMPDDPFPLHFYRTAARLRGSAPVAKGACRLSKEVMLSKQRNSTCGYLRQAAQLAGVSTSVASTACRQLYDQFFDKPVASCPAEQSMLHKFLNWVGLASSTHRSTHQLKHLFPLELASLLHDWHQLLYASARANKTLPTMRLHPGAQPMPVQSHWHHLWHRTEIFSDPVAEALNHALAPIAECIMGTESLFPTYVWSVEYQGRAAGISPHTDQPDNEISMSYQVSPTGVEEPWPLFFAESGLPNLSPGESSRKVTKLTDAHLAQTQRVEMTANQAVIYRGRDLVHWRFARSDVNVLVDQRQVLFAWRQVQHNVCSISQLGRQMEPQRQVITPLLAPTEEWTTKTPVNVGLNSNSPEL